MKFPNRIAGTATILLTIGLLFAALNLVRARIEASVADRLSGNELLFLPDWRVLHAFALGDDATAADLLWLRGVFYIAAQHFEEKQMVSLGLEPCEDCGSRHQHHQHGQALSRPNQHEDESAAGGAARHA